MTLSRPHALCTILLATALTATPTRAQQPAAPSPTAAAATSGNFDASATAALAAMQQRATELNISGVAVIAYFEGDKIQSWSSRMQVVGRLVDPGSDTKKGSNLLAVAYSKASEMAETLKNSGSNTRPPLTGEFGWSGGLIAQTKHGYIIAAFSGGKSEDDVQVSHTGIEQMKAHL